MWLSDNIQFFLDSPTLPSYPYDESGIKSVSSSKSLILCESRDRGQKDPNWEAMRVSW